MNNDSKIYKFVDEVFDFNEVYREKTVTEAQNYDRIVKDTDGHWFNGKHFIRPIKKLGRYIMSLKKTIFILMICYIKIEDKINFENGCFKTKIKPRGEYKLIGAQTRPEFEYIKMVKHV